MTSAGPPAPAAITLAAHADVDFDAWLDWADDAGAPIDMTTHLAARVRFGPHGSWETPPADIDTTTDPVTVGKIYLAATTPVMRLHIPAVVMAAVDFRAMHYVLEVTDPAGVTRRWAEGDMTLDKAEV